MSLTILNGISAGNHNEGFTRAPDPLKLFSTEHAFAHMGVSAFGLFNESRWKTRDPKDHQGRWVHTMSQSWLDGWAEWFDRFGWLVRSEDFEGFKRITLLIDNESLWPTAEHYMARDEDGNPDNHDELFVDGGKSDELSPMGLIYNAVAPSSLAWMTAHILDLARARWPHAHVDVCHSNMVMRPAIAAHTYEKARPGALRAFGLIPTDHRRRALKIRFMRDDRPRNLAESISWATMALGARAQFGDPPTVAEHWWLVRAGILPTIEQVAGAMIACGRAGIPFSPSGGVKDINDNLEGGYDAYCQHLLHAKEIAMAVRKQEAA